MSPLRTAPAGGSGQGRGWLGAATATWAPERAPRGGSPVRQHTLPFASAPSLPPFGPPGSTFLPFFPLPFSPLPGPRRAATRSVYGGAGRGELPGRQAPPRAGTRPERQAAGVQVEVLSGALGAGVLNRWMGSGSSFSAAGCYRKGAGHSPTREHRLLWVAGLQEGEKVWWLSPPKAAPPAPRSPEEGPRLPLEAANLMGKGGRVGRGAHFFLINVLPF